MNREKTAAETLFYTYNQNQEYFKAARAVESKYEPKYARLMEAMSPDTREKFDETIANNCDDYCLLGFELGMAVALNLKGEVDTLIRSKLISNDSFVENDTYYCFDSSGEVIELMHENNAWDLMVAALRIGYATPEDAKEHEAEVLGKLGLTSWPWEPESGGEA